MHPLTAQSQIAELVERYQGERPWSTLLELHRGDRGRLALSLGFYVIKHSPVWILPVVVADIVDVLVTDRSLGTLWPELALFAFAVVQNIPTHWLHIRFLSLATHRMEARLRLAVAWNLLGRGGLYARLHALQG
jgi:ATP-binding cassette subfamily B protein